MNGCLKIIISFIRLQAAANALGDATFDTNKAIELLLEKGNDYFENKAKDDKKKKDVVQADTTAGDSTRSASRETEKSNASKNNKIDICEQILDKVKKAECSRPFAKPVKDNKDLSKKEKDEFYKQTDNAMCLEDVETKLEKGTYKNPMDFITDMRLIARNACLFFTDKKIRTVHFFYHCSTLL